MSKHIKILVPVDFTDASTSAINFVIGMSGKMSLSIELLHIIAGESEFQRANLEFESYKQNFNFGALSVEHKVIEGNVLEDIGKIAESMECDLIVMGTHGERGMQKVFGSYALKVVGNSKVPLIIVQEETKFTNIQSIAMTIDLEKESIQIIKAAALLAKQFGAKIHLIGGRQDDSFLKTKVNTNMILCKEFLMSENVDHEFHLLERKNFEENLIDFCRDNSMDMLAATFYADTFYVFSTKFVQHLLMNELHMPVITIDSSSTSSGSQYGFLTV